MGAIVEIHSSKEVAHRLRGGEATSRRLNKGTRTSPLPASRPASNDLSLSFFDLWQFNPETCPLPFLRLQSDTATHSFGAFPDNRQSNAGALILFEIVKSIEQTKDLLLMLFRDADAIVA